MNFDSTKYDLEAALLNLDSTKAKMKYPVKIIVGGAPFRMDELLWENVGADAFGKTSADAVTALQTVISRM